MPKLDWKVFLEAIKEPLRLLLLAVIPFALNYFDTISAEWAVIIVFILRFLDKYLHLQAPEGTSGGLTRF